MKRELRKKFRALRNNLSANRRETASRQIQEKLLFLSSRFDRIASFSSFQNEIDLFSLNCSLAQQGRLLLPRREKGTLRFFLVTELLLNQDCLFEPDPSRCASVDLSIRDLLLVPALAFDADCFRLGYGKGFYDHFIKDHAGIYAMGIGFSEQFSLDPLPRDPWDQPVCDLLLS
jgi:5-formyltetrahydrofolate cyclo-ligase